MALEKKKKLRTIELTFTDDLLHTKCHCVYNEVIEEDGKEIARNVHRELHKTADVVSDISKREYLGHPQV